MCKRMICSQCYLTVSFKCLATSLGTQHATRRVVHQVSWKNRIFILVIFALIKAYKSFRLFAFQTKLKQKQMNRSALWPKNDGQQCHPQFRVTDVLAKCSEIYDYRHFLTMLLFQDLRLGDECVGSYVLYQLRCSPEPTRHLPIQKCGHERIRKRF